MNQQTVLNIGQGRTLPTIPTSNNIPQISKKSIKTQTAESRRSENTPFNQQSASMDIITEIFGKSRKIKKR